MLVWKNKGGRNMSKREEQNKKRIHASREELGVRSRSGWKLVWKEKRAEEPEQEGLLVL